MPFVQFTDNTETAVCAVFSCAQSATAYPNQANIAATDARYQAFVNPQPTAGQAAITAGMAALNAGIAITSTSNSALNGTYALTSNTMIMLSGAVAYCLLNGNFPGNASTLIFFDASGAGHVFSTVAEFELFSEAVASYVTPIQDYINSNGTVGALPTSNAVTIA